ncbi:MAG: hypothetical protein U0L49_00130 [Eubacterium sp.]|nr:hypothetical protein [Eubacterium sp.]
MNKTHYTREELRKIVRLEDLGTDIWEPAEYDQVTCDGIYNITLEDLRTAINKIVEKKLPLNDVMNWCMCLDSNLSAWIGPLEVTGFEYEDEIPWYEFPEDELGAIAAVWNLLFNLDFEIDMMENQGTGDQIDCIRKAQEYISCFIGNQGLPKEKWVYPEYMKEDFISAFDSDEALAAATKEEQKRFVLWVDELALKNNERALHARCYGKYTGNAVYKQDFIAARDDAERLFELTRNPQYANTLGYIYYYGRCTHGEPEYDKALTFFTYGAANGLNESIYKLSDMYKNGYGVVESPETAYRLVSMLYDELSARFEKQQGENQFADVALRIGSMRLHGTGTQQNVRGGIGVLLAAEYAIQKRMKEHDFYGDNVVAANIRRCLAEAKELLPPKKNTGRYKDESFWSVKRLLKDDYKIRWKARQLKNGDWSVTFRRIAKRNEAEPRKLFFVISNLYFCTFTDTVKGHVKPLAGEMPAEGKADFLDTVYENDEPVTVFYYDDKPVLKLKGNDFDWRIPKPKKASGRTVRLVGITFTPGGRQYDYLCDIEDIKIGDRVIVNGYEGETEVIVQNISEVPEEELALPQEKYKKIIRKIYSISF